MLALPALGLAQGKLDQVRDAVDRPGASAAKGDKESSSDDSSGLPSTGWGSGTGDGGIDALFAVCAAPWAIPYLLADPGQGDRG